MNDVITLMQYWYITFVDVLFDLIIKIEKIKNILQKKINECLKLLLINWLIVIKWTLRLDVHVHADF